MVLLLQAASPTLDGTLGPGEYPVTPTFTGSNGLELRHRATPEALYLAVVGTAGGYPHVALTRGDTVILLHASSALGSARFAGVGPTKSRVQEFAWDLRNAGTGATGVAARAQYLARHGWTATTIEMGTPGVTEFQISRHLLPPGTRVAVGFWSPTTVHRWPAALSDDAVAPRMVQGFLPERATFALNAWGSSP